MEMEIHILNNYQTDENTYLLIKNDEALVIDPGINEKEIISAAEHKHASIKYIMLTHCHYDHIIALEALRARTGARLVVSKLISMNISDPSINLSAASLGYRISARPADIVLKDNEVIRLMDTDIKCIFTPGHTNCGVCYLIENMLFTGDTLFLRSVGRTDLPTGDRRMLYDSIKNRIYTLPDDVVVYPGHGSKTSVGYEKKFNFYVNE